MLTIPAPPSKSQTHRALILAALASGPSRVLRPLASDDTQHTRACLEQLGARFHPLPGGQGFQVEPIPIAQGPIQAELFVGESGTTCRLITAVAAALPGHYRIHGAGRMHQRPIGPLALALEGLGASIAFENQPGCPPLRLASQGLRGSQTQVDISHSSQFLSALLLAAPRSGQEVTIRLTGSRMASWPYALLTLQAMAEASVRVAVEAEDASGRFSPCPPQEVDGLPPERIRLRVPAAHYQPGEFRVEGDWSSASYFLAAGALGRVPVQVTGLRPDSLQADRAIVGIMGRMGAKVEITSEGVTVFPSPLCGAHISMESCPDIVPTVAMLAATAQGTTRICGVAHLRIKESDRIAAVVEGLCRLGLAAHPTADGMIIHGGTLANGPVSLRTHGDHRLAMSLSLAELGGAQIHLDTPECVRKSYPGFWEEWQKVRAANLEGPHAG
jgi:3-phosphoshikimate 1-carboxyvinyltransferase